MSIISSPFDLSSSIFTQKYAATTDDFGGNGGGSGGGSGGGNGGEDETLYDTASKIRSGWRNCALTTSQAKDFLCAINSDACNWSDGEWTDFLESESTLLYPVRRYTDCEVSAWGAWSDCEAYQGVYRTDDMEHLGGEQHRERTIVKHRLSNCVELNCEKELLEYRYCEPPRSHPVECEEGEVVSSDGVTCIEDTNGGGNGGGQEGCPRGDENREAADEAGECGSCLDGFIDDDIWGCVEETTTSDTDADTDSLGDKLKEHWMLIGLGIVGLALLG
jgi:hypothetical protein